MARRELEAAGFVFVEESQILRNPADNRTERVFDRRGIDGEIIRLFDPVNHVRMASTDASQSVIAAAAQDRRWEQIRRQAYWALLCGTCGQFLGNNPLWHFDGPGLYAVKQTWQEALNSPGSRDISRLASLFQPIPWHELRLVGKDFTAPGIHQHFTAVHAGVGIQDFLV